jgi:micrococcal nuclease
MNMKSGPTRHTISAILYHFIPPLFLSIVCASLAITQSWHSAQRVIDGDTFVLENGERVRLIGVDTPETAHPSKEIEPFAEEASEFAKSMLEGKKVRLEFDVRKRDRYGRLLAYVYLQDGTFVNAELVRQGYAHAATYPPNVRHAEEFRQWEKEARNKKRGLWKP